MSDRTLQVLLSKCVVCGGDPYLGGPDASEKPVMWCEEHYPYAFPFEETAPGWARPVAIPKEGEK